MGSRSNKYIWNTNVIEAAIGNDVQKVIDISTDKAVDPFNHYGVTKANSENDYKCLF